MALLRPALQASASLHVVGMKGRPSANGAIVTGLFLSHALPSHLPSSGHPMHLPQALYWEMPMFFEVPLNKPFLPQNAEVTP
jgi:hypothetical protein